MNRVRAPLAELAFMFACSIAASGALAVDTPRAGSYDSRVRFVEYNAENVVRVIAHYGFQIHIQFSEGEVVKHLAIGDEGAWIIGPKAPANHLFVKPKGERATTNMSVVTTKAGRDRAYQFHLAAAWPGRTGAGEPYFHLKFRYSGDERERLTAEQQRVNTKSLLATAQKSRSQNRDYWVCGSDAIAPDEAFDDGTFTFFRFAANREIPAIYHVNEDGSEAVVNVHLEGDWHIVQRVSPQMVLRKGRAVACVVNKRFDPYGVREATRTTSPHVERVIVGDP